MGRRRRGLQAFVMLLVRQTSKVECVRRWTVARTKQRLGPLDHHRGYLWAGRAGGRDPRATAAGSSSSPAAKGGGKGRLRGLQPRRAAPTCRRSFELVQWTARSNIRRGHPITTFGLFSGKTINTRVFDGCFEGAVRRIRWWLLFFVMTCGRRTPGTGTGAGPRKTRCTGSQTMGRC